MTSPENASEYKFWPTCGRPELCLTTSMRKSNTLWAEGVYQCGRFDFDFSPGPKHPIAQRSPSVLGSPTKHRPRSNTLWAEEFCSVSFSPPLKINHCVFDSCTRLFLLADSFRVSGIGFIEHGCNHVEINKNTCFVRVVMTSENRRHSETTKLCFRNFFELNPSSCANIFIFYFVWASRAEGGGGRHHVFV